MKNEIMRTNNPTKGQLIYLRDLCNKEELIEYMALKWEYVFNYGKLTNTDLNKFHSELKLLGLTSIEVTSNMSDYGLI